MDKLLATDMKFVYQYPEGFTPEKTYPVILMLHGAGSRGDDPQKLFSNPYFSITAQHLEFPFITVAPLCTENTWFDMMEQLKKFVQQLVKLSFVDARRIYLMGASMGGYATWQLAMSMPECFAAIVPICGGGMYWNAGRLINTPVWAFHGQLDKSVFVEESVKMVEAVNRKGGNAKLTIYPETGHAAWTETYANPEVFTWLLQQENQNNKDYIDQYNSAATYG